MIRATSNFADVPCHDSDTRPSRPHLCDQGYGTKPVLPAAGLQIGTSQDGSQHVAVIILDGPGMPWALTNSMSAEEARDIAAALIEAAVDLETAAASAAAAALAKAAGK